MTLARSIRLTVRAALVLVLLDLAVGFAWLGAGSAAAPQDVRSFEDAVRLHNAARDGDKSVLGSAIKALRRLRREDPWDTESTAYLVSAYAIAVRDGWFGPTQLVNATRAIHHLNAALDFAPDSFEVRAVRISAYSHLPRIFGRKGAAIRDGIVLDRMFQQIEDPHHSMVSAMLPVYDFLNVAAPDRGDWDKVKMKASAAIDDHY